MRIRRAHLEEDAGKLLHEAPGGYSIPTASIDLNRGTELRCSKSIITEPDLSTPEQVRVFAGKSCTLRSCQFLGVSEAQMQMGQMRLSSRTSTCHITDADGNVHKTAITEIKNLNSFSVLERATAYEIQRQIREWEETGSLGKKSTYGWDEGQNQTFHQPRQKEKNCTIIDISQILIFVAGRGQRGMAHGVEVANLGVARGASPAIHRGAWFAPVADAIFLASDRAAGDFFEAALAGGGRGLGASRT